jgi:O-antigen/teichoic acid export membrane protein
MILEGSDPVMSRAIGRFSRLSRIFAVFRLRPFDSATESGRSKERLRRAALTTVGSSASKAVSLLSTLVSVPLTYRYLGPERYGIWMVLISIIGAMSFADLGIGNGLVNAISEAYGRDDRKLARQHVSSALALMLTIAAALALIGTVAYPFLPWLRLFNVKSNATALEGAQAFLVLYASFVVNIPLGVITRTQSGIQKGYIAQVVNALGGIASLGLILLVISLHGSLAWLVFASVGAGVVATLINGWILFREYPWLLPSSHAIRADSAKKIFKLGLLFFVLQCSFTLAFTSDNIVIAQILGAAAVAVYSVPQKLFSFVAAIVAMAVGPLWPAYGEAIARGDVQWVRRIFLGSLWFVLGISIPLCVLLGVAGPWILRVAVGKSFHAPVVLIIVLSIWGVVNSVSQVGSILLNGAGVLRPQVLLAVVVGVSNLALSIFLTKSFGVVGVCLGSILTQVLITFPTYVFLIRGLFERLSTAGASDAIRGITPQLESI